MSRACLLPYDLRDKPEVRACVKRLKRDSLELIERIYTLIMKNGRQWCPLEDVMALSGYNRYRIVRLRRILYDFSLFSVKDGRVSRRECLMWRPAKKDLLQELSQRDNSQTLFPEALDEMDQKAMNRLNNDFV